MKRNSISKDKILYVLLTAIAVFCLYVKARYGICEDEEFFVSLIYRISKGINNTIIYKIWDSYQLTGTIFSPLVALYHNVIGGYDYLYLFLRLFAILLLLLTTIYFFNFCKNELETSTKLSFVLSIIYLLSVPKLGYNIDNSLQLMIYFTIFACELYKFIKHKNYINLIISAIFYCFSILAYITVIFSLPVVLILMFFYLKNDSNNNIKPLITYLLICVLLGTIFLLIFVDFSNFSYDNFIYNIGQIVEGESVNFNIFKKLIHDIKRFSISLIVFFVPVILLDFLINKKDNIKNRIINAFINAYSLINVVVIVLTLTRIIEISIFTLMIRLIPLLVLMMIKIGKDKFNIINCLYLTLLLICYTSTDQYIDTQARYAFTSILLSFAYIYKDLDVVKKSNYIYLSLVSALIFAIYSTGIYVPVDMNANSNIFNDFVTTDVSPFQGLYLDEDRKEDYEDLNKFDIKNEQVTIVSGYIRGGWYIVNENDPLVPFTETGYLPRYKWSNYFEHNNIKNGILLVHTKYYATIEDFAKKFVFGDYILNNYQIEEVHRGNRFVEYKYNSNTK